MKWTQIALLTSIAVATSHAWSARSAQAMCKPTSENNPTTSYLAEDDEDDEGEDEDDCDDDCKKSKKAAKKSKGKKFSRAKNGPDIDAVLKMLSEKREKRMPPMMAPGMPPSFRNSPWPNGSPPMGGFGSFPYGFQPHAPSQAVHPAEQLEVLRNIEKTLKSIESMMREQKANNSGPREGQAVPMDFMREMRRPNYMNPGPQGPQRPRGPEGSMDNRPDPDRRPERIERSEPS